ncbi:MAG: ABC transporter permease [Spirochaetaceae bacterium]|nr:MAG: ABC transporter permease [Spirochaetaceae bacterium]
MTLLRIRAMARKETLHILRDWRTLGILVVLPVALLLFFGYAIDLDVTDVRIGIYDEDRSPESRRAITVLENSGYFRRISVVEHPREGRYLLDSEQIDLFLHVPRGYARTLLRGEDARIGVQVDGTNPQIGSGIVGLVEATLGAIGRGGAHAPVRTRIWYNPRLESAQILIPGLIAIILVITAVVSTAVGIAREREEGSMEQLSVSPLRPVELVIGKTVPYAVISALVSVLVIVLGVAFFGVRSAGSMAALTAATALFLLACLGLGVLISTIARTQQVAFIIAVLVTFLPTFLLSGFVFPVRNMPLPIRNASRIFPGRYFLEALRSIMLKGGGFEVVTEELAALAIFTAVTGSIAVLRVRRIVGGSG